MQYMVYGGAVLAVLGLVGIGYCVWMARGIKRDADAGSDTKDRIQTLVALNTASLGIAFIGLAAATVGVLMS
ncbi:MAG: hypothetical protein L3J33_05370 [Rhodobacteraceae bacterium]|nr:hypothetical protein [Paracoccaceae bacterium]